MSATGLDVFDKTLQTTNTWLKRMMDAEAIGPDRQVAWHVLGAVLRALRDRVPLELAAHLGSQLPLLVRGAYSDQWRPVAAPEKYRTLEDFAERVGEGLANIRPVNRIRCDPRRVRRAQPPYSGRPDRQGAGHPARGRARAVGAGPAAGGGLSGAPHTSMRA